MSFVKKKIKGKKRKIVKIKKGGGAETPGVTINSLPPPLLPSPLFNNSGATSRISFLSFWIGFAAGHQLVSRRIGIPVTATPLI